MVHGRVVLALLCLDVAPSVCSGCISALAGLGIAVAIAFGKKKRSFDCSYSRTYVLSRVLVMTIRSFRWIVSACLPEPEGSHGHPYSAAWNGRSPGAPVSEQDRPMHLVCGERNRQMDVRRPPAIGSDDGVCASNKFIVSSLAGEG